MAYEILDKFEASVRTELADLDATLKKLRSSRNLDVFALNERMLEVSLAPYFDGLSLGHFDQGVLAAVLGRADELRDKADVELFFCERDGDLQPWDRNGDVKQPLKSIYDKRHIRVYGDFNMSREDPSKN